MAKVKYRIREFKPTQNQTGGGDTGGGGDNNPPSGELEG